MRPYIPENKPYRPLLTASNFSWRSLLHKGLKGVGYVYFIGAVWAVKAYLDMRTAASVYDNEVFEASVESGDWRCYNATKQYHEECSVLDPYVERETDICATLHHVMSDCKDILYRYITVTSTPAMQDTSYLFNRPDWLA